MKNNLYISYAWKDREQEEEDSREEIVNRLCEAFEAKGYHVIRDKSDMSYRDVIREFMNDIAGASALIAVISEKYLKSPYCMYELAAAWDKGNFRNRIFPIVLPDADIYDDLKQIQLVKYWKKQYQDYQEAISELDDVAKEGFLQKLRDREYIYQRVSGAISTISGMVGISSNLLLKSYFEEIIKQIEQKIGGNSVEVGSMVTEKEVSMSDLLDNGLIDKTFEEIEKKEINDRFLYNRLKIEYIAGNLTGIQFADWIQKMKVFINSL